MPRDGTGNPPKRHGVVEAQFETKTYEQTDHSHKSRQKLGARQRLDRGFNQEEIIPPDKAVVIRDELFGQTDGSQCDFPLTITFMEREKRT